MMSAVSVPIKDNRGR